MNPDTQLSTEQPAELAAPSGPAPVLNVAEILQAAVQGGVTGDKVAVVKELVALQERMEQRAAEKAFARAFNALQADMPSVQAASVVKNNDGSERYKFAEYADIMGHVRPFLLKHGFTVAFSMKVDEGRVTQICALTHVDGHSKSNEFSVRIGKGPPGSSESQADGAAGTYAKRHALCSALNIVIEKDTDGVATDAREIGAPIPPDKVQYLREQCRELGGNAEAQLLNVAGVAKLEQIGEAIYPVLIRMIDGRRAAAKGAR